jgi:hypothetical protein
LALWASTKYISIILLSATSPPCLEKRLLRNYKLDMGSTAFIRSGTGRPEIGLHTVQLDPLLPEEALSHLVHALKGRLEKDERMLVFFESCALAGAFSEKSRCAVFHSRLPASGNTKSYNLSIWDEGETTVMACTSAFASGVDRPRVRFVVIHSPRHSLTTTMQMAGRAGRDGKESHVFFATAETQGASFPDGGNPDMPWELGQLVHRKQCRAYQWALYMDGEALARECSRSPMQVPCDVCDPGGEMHTFALNAVKNPGRPVGRSTVGGAGAAGGAAASSSKVGAR